MSKPRSTIVSLAVVALSASFAAGAVASEEPSEDGLVGVYSIEGMTWLLTSQMVDGEMVDVPAGLNVSLQMEDGRAGGNGGCNSYFTDYELDGFDVSFGPVGSTMMACLPPVMDVEQAFFANLGEVVAYQSGGIQMALLNGAGDFILEFDLAPAATVVGSWVAQGINNGTGGVESNEFTAMVTAEFDEEGRLAGVDGCNNYSTTYELEGESITIAPEIATTMMFCEEPPAELSQQYFAALGGRGHVGRRRRGLARAARRRGCATGEVPARRVAAVHAGLDAGTPAGAPASIATGVALRSRSPYVVVGLLRPRYRRNRVNSSRDNEPAVIAADRPRTRRQLLAAGGVAAVAGVLGALGVSNTVEAKDGQWLRAGKKNTATNSTTLQAKKGPGFLARVTGSGRAVGLRGYATSTKGVGVQGWADNKKGATVGVEGQTKSSDGKAGLFTAANGGTALVARSPDKRGVALRTEGRLMFSKRSGVTSVSAGSQDIITPVGGGLSERSMVHATLQDFRPGVHVTAAYVVEPGADGLITIRLSKAVAEADAGRLARTRLSPPSA